MPSSASPPDDGSGIASPGDPRETTIPRDGDARPHSEPLRIGDLTASIPLVQGGMGVGISLAGLASAVAEEGGIGVISSVGIGMLEADFYASPLQANVRALRREIRKARERTDGIIGVNIMVAVSDMTQLVNVAVEEGVDVIFSGAGLPLQLPETVPPKAKTKLVPIVSSARAAALLCRRWKSRYDRYPDAFVVEGPQAGGHLGFTPEQVGDPAFRLESLVVQTLEAIKPFEKHYRVTIPVIAAGGIYTGHDIRRYMEMGCAGVQMGTRFVVTHECDASPAFKHAYLQCTEADLILIQSPVGMPGRAIQNPFLEAVSRGEHAPIACPLRCILSCPGKKAPYCIANALLNAHRGVFSEGFAFAGANAYRTEKLCSVKELIAELMRDLHG